MKKILLPLLIITLAITLLINKTYSTATYTGGDVNNDGITNKTDAMLIAKYIVDSSNVDEINLDNADVNGDGKIKMNDVMIIALGKIVDSILPTSINLEQDFINLEIEETQTLTASLLPNNTTNKTITWVSSNTDVATVNEEGLVTAIKEGVATITATTSNNLSKEATIIVNKYDIFDSYDGETLKYYIERPNNTYIISRIWVDNAYEQMKVGITEEMASEEEYKTNSTAEEKAVIDRINTCYNDTTRTYKMYKPMEATSLISTIISNNHYENKAMLAINASSIVSEKFNNTAPCNWYGTAALPIIINNDTEIRNSISEEEVNISSYNQIYGLTSDKTLKRYSYTNNNTIDTNKLNNLKTNLNEDGVKNTFGFRITLLENGTIQTTTETNDIRQALCQIDKNNYIIISSTLVNNPNRETDGLNPKQMAQELLNYGCVNAYNLDGGGSQVYFYKKNTNDLSDVRNILNSTNLSLSEATSYDGRGLVDMLYFVEK